MFCLDSRKDLKEADGELLSFPNLKLSIMLCLWGLVKEELEHVCSN